MGLTAWRLLAIASLIASAGAATRPHYGGTLRVDINARVASLHPAELAAQDDLAALVFDRLVSWNDSGQLQPALATSWRHDPDFKRWEFQLRPGVRFHDGSPLIAAVAAAALERLGAAAQGDILVIRTEAPTPKLLALLAAAGQSIWKRSAEGALSGTGPFRIVSWDSGHRAVFAANDDYWAGRPYLDRIEIEMGRAARDQALDFDLNKADIVELGAGDARRAAQNGRKIWSSAPVDLIAIVFNTAVEEPVREAIALSIDRASIHTVLLQKQGTVTGALLPQWLSGYAFLFPDARDVERSRRTVSTVAHAIPPLTIAYDPRDPNARPIAERIAVNTREVGIVLRPVPEPQPASLSLLRKRFHSPDADEALAALSVAPPVAATPDLRYSAERALLEGYRTIPLFHLPEVYGLGSRVKNWSATRWGAWKLDSVWLAP